MNSRKPATFCLLVALCWALVACAPAPNRAPPAGDYRHTLTLQTPHVLLKQLMTEQLAAERLVLTENAPFADLNLTLSATPFAADTLRKSPRLFGRLQKEGHPQGAVISYILATSSGDVLTQGEAVALAAEKNIFFPRSNTQNVLQDARTMAEASQQIVAAILPHTQQKEWQTRVISVQNSSAIMATAGRQAGLKVFDHLTNRATPETVLEVATFEQMGNGHERAILRVIKGPVPTTGMIFFRAH